MFERLFNPLSKRLADTEVSMLAVTSVMQNLKGKHTTDEKIAISLDLKYAISKLFAAQSQLVFTHADDLTIIEKLLNNCQHLVETVLTYSNHFNWGVKKFFFQKVKLHCQLTLEVIKSNHKKLLGLDLGKLKKHLLHLSNYTCNTDSIFELLDCVEQAPKDVCEKMKVTIKKLLLESLYSEGVSNFFLENHALLLKDINELCDRPPSPSVNNGSPR